MRVGRWRSLVVWGTGLAAVVWAVTGVRVVGPTERGVLQRFGRVVNTRVPSGVHLLLPAGIDRLRTLRMRQTRRSTLGGLPGERTAGGLAPPGISSFVTGDRNVVNVRGTVQYVVRDPRDYLFACTEPDALVRNAAEAAAAVELAGLPVDDVLTRRKAEIQNNVRAGAQELLDRYGCGITITSVSLERIQPPEGVKDAFRDVISARVDARRLKDEAEGYRNDLISRAVGEAEAVRKRAEADAYAVVARARGRAARFNDIEEEMRKGNPDLTRVRLFVQTLENTLKRVRLVVVDPSRPTDIRLLEDSP